MQKAVIVLVRRPWNPVSWLIRWALPVSRFRWGRASHSMIIDGEYAIHATMLRGVVREPIQQAMRGQVIVAHREFEVPNAAAGLEWARSQVGRKYDFAGAFGLSIHPDREWADDSGWFCHELCAAYLHACGRRLFDKFGHVTDSALMLACAIITRDGDEPIYYSRRPAN